MERFELGKISLGEKVDITDPCYDKDVWCRKTLPCNPGDYRCYYWIGSDGWGEAVSMCAVVKDSPEIIAMVNSGMSRIWDYVGEIGVDAGLAGFFDNKKDFTDDEWQALCNELYPGGNVDKSAWIKSFDGRDGFFTFSGHGDGGYPVEAIFDENEKVIAARITFLEEDY